MKYHLLILAKASIESGHFPSSFKETTTVALRKSHKSDYTKSNVYRLIALKNIIDKVLESIMMENIAYLTEIHHLLPTHHFEGRPGRIIEDALIFLMKNIYAA